MTSAVAFSMREDSIPEWHRLGADALRARENDTDAVARRCALRESPEARKKVARLVAADHGRK